jgi:hypothetical protein
MSKPRAELDFALDELAAWVPTMLSETDEASQMDAFACRADLIRDAAGPDDVAYITDRLQRILVDNCMVPADESPCDD